MPPRQLMPFRRAPATLSGRRAGRTYLAAILTTPATSAGVWPLAELASPFARAARCHQRRALSPPRPPAARGRAHLHPRECTIAEAGCRLEPNAERHLKRGREMARLFAPYPQAVARTLRSPSRITSTSTSCATSTPTSRCRRARPRRYLEELTWAPPAALPDGVPDKVQRATRQGARAHREARLRPLLPHRPRHRPLRRSQEADPVPGPRLGRQHRGLLLPRRHLRRSRSRSTCCSSASSRPPAASRPTSTSTSSTSGARR